MTRQEKRQQAWRLRRFKWRYCGLQRYLLLGAVVPLMLILFLGWLLGVQTPHSRALLDRGPIPLQECGSFGSFGGEYVFLDVAEVSDVFIHRAAHRSRPDAYLYEIAAQDGSRWLVLARRKNHAPESEWLARLKRSGGRVTGMTSTLGWDWAREISAAWPYQLQPEEVRERYGRIMLILDAGPPAPLEGQGLTRCLRATVVHSVLWALLMAVLWLLVTRPMEQCLRAVQKKGLADQLLEDWAGASPFFKKRGLWLGKRFLFIGGLGPFFIGYDEIREISYPSFPEGYAEYILERGEWPRHHRWGYTRQERTEAYAKLPRDPTDEKHTVTAPMMVVWLKDGRKLTLGTGRWPSGAAYAQDRALLRDYIRYRMQNPPPARPPRPAKTGSSHRMA